ncbi:hypothetical protein PF005_g14984 [Phytophthora fragariae]|uniref:Uncharacterized protein n=2 Tax=Phytophthora fragariae TaxID=53985 RepID=A0A6A3FJM4_9STRA|nr:hypothetical protein PF003_g15316 [Phytophthora fragariae]KAE8945989.1 hypothetical protein PF009_g4372 [Phytophthora fragariae]KAE9104078.1 hypothetical protein PF006_g22014 [Phytophthora fragariae]KAE9113554.1 hypothetical protein PF007_g10688 [Phytophthora fragariae]KAE9201349.1 hypothetical protein PF005_g14984 [Phytophthora fragariae]
METPHPDDSFHVVVDMPFTVKEGRRWPRTTMATSQRQRSRMLGWGPEPGGGSAARGDSSSPGPRPGAVERLRADVASLFRETRDLHGCVDRQADLSSYDSLQSQLAGLRAELHGHAPHPEQQPHSYQAQFDQGLYGAPAYAAPMYAAPFYDQRAHQAPYRDPTPRFEKLRSPSPGYPPLPAAQPEPEGHGTS